MLRIRLAPLLLAAALTAAVLTACGGARISTSKQTGATAVPQVMQGTAVYLSLGDSIQYGCCGDRARSSGELFRQYLEQSLRRPVEWVTIAESPTSDQFIQDLLPRAEALIALRRQQDRPVVAITMDVGGIDLGSLTDPATGERCAVSPSDACRPLVQAALARLRLNYDEILSRLIAAKDPATPILVLTSFNPWDTGDGNPAVERIERAIADLNQVFREKVQEYGLTLVDIYPEFKGRARDLINGVDPSDEGHAVIAAAYERAYESLPDSVRDQFRQPTDKGTGASPAATSASQSAGGWVTATEAAEVIRRVEGAFPLLVPGALLQGWLADVQTNVWSLSDFSVSYRDAADSTRSVGLCLCAANPPLPAASTIQRNVGFRGDADALYQAEPAGAPGAYQLVMWEEPGRWDAGWGPERGTVPYLLSATGLTELEFWQMAASLARLQPD